MNNHRIDQFVMSGWRNRSTVANIYTKELWEVSTGSRMKDLLHILCLISINEDSAKHQSVIEPMNYNGSRLDRPLPKFAGTFLPYICIQNCIREI